jgi:hypothetical protein
MAPDNFDDLRCGAVRPMLASASRIGFSVRCHDPPHARLVVEDRAPGITLVDEAARPATPAYDADRRFIPGPNGPLRLDRGQPYRG